jgi:hypothetical protein
VSTYYTPPNPAPSPAQGRTLVLHDGSPAALLACAITREALSLSPNPKASRDLAAIAHNAPRPRVNAIARQCELFGVTLLEHEPLPLPASLAPFDRETHELLHAVRFAAHQGCDRVLWPVSGAQGDHLDLDRIAAIVDRCVLIGRLVALDAREHKTPSIRIEAPYADYTDRQVADLIADMELPLETCWWWSIAGDGEAEREKRRWLSAMGAVGWTLAGR